MGTDQGIYPWVSTLVIGNLMGRRFWVGRGFFFLWIPGRRTAETFSQDDTSSKHPWVYVIYYMLNSGGFAVVCLQDIAKGVLDPRLPWADTCAVRLRQPVDLVHGLKTVKGLLLLVPARTPRSSGYDVYAHAGCRRLARKRLYAEDRGLQVPMVLDHDNTS